MSKDELLRLLDLNNKDPVPAVELDITAATPRATPRSTHVTAFPLDPWSLRRGQDLLEESERLAQLQLNHFAIADFHTAAFAPDPQLHPDCLDTQRHAFLHQLLETPEYQALHAATYLNDASSAIAATAFAEQFANLQNQEHDSEPKENIDQEMATLRAVGRAVTTAQAEVTECQEAVGALGLGPGAPGSNDAQAIAALFRRVRSSPTLRRICTLAGKFRHYAQSQQRRKTTHGQDDMVGVELDGDLGRVLPSELAKLALPELELDTLRRLVERQMLCRHYQATEPVAQGPIILCLDESGSMHGEKAHTAKALGLALAWIARQQQRWCGLVAYSGDSGERVLSLPPRRWHEVQLLDWLEAFIGGGSAIDVPVRELPRIYQQLRAPVGATDVIFITDAQCHLPAELQQAFRAWKTSVQARLITLVMGSEPGDLAHISDEVHIVKNLTIEETGIDRILSL